MYTFNLTNIFIISTFKFMLIAVTVFINNIHANSKKYIEFMEHVRLDNITRMSSKHFAKEPSLNERDFKYTTSPDDTSDNITLLDDSIVTIYPTLYDDMTMGEDTTESEDYTVDEELTPFADSTMTEEVSIMDDSDISEVTTTYEIVTTIQTEPLFPSTTILPSNSSSNDSSNWYHIRILKLLGLE